MSDKLPKINRGDTTFDKVWAYYKDQSIKLTPKQEEKRQRWAALFALRINFKSRLQAVRAYQDTLISDGKEPVSDAQLYKDMAMAERLYGDVHRSDKRASLVVLTEYAHRNLEMALKQENPIAVTQALGKLEKYMEIDKEESVHFNPEKLEDKPDYFTVPKQVMEAISSHFGSGVIDFNNLEVEDIQAEEVKDEEE